MRNPNVIQIIKTAHKRVDKLEIAANLLTKFLNKWSADAQASGKSDFAGGFYSSTVYQRNVLQRLADYFKNKEGGAVPIDSYEDARMIQTIYNAKKLTYGEFTHKF